MGTIFAAGFCCWNRLLLLEDGRIPLREDGLRYGKMDG